jgi:hypothetical protein
MTNTTTALMALISTIITIGFAPLFCYLAYQVDPSFGLAGLGLGVVAGPVIAGAVIQ